MADFLNLVSDTDGTIRRLKSDRGGRAIPSYYLRDITATGSATMTRAVETSIISGVAGTFQDLFMVTGANTSSVAIRVDLRYGTGGAVIDSLVIPATNVASKTFQVPYPMTEKAQAITAQNNVTDMSDSPVTITMLAIIQP